MTGGGGTVAGGKVAGGVLTALGFFCSGGTGRPPRPLWYPVMSATSSGDDASGITGSSGVEPGAAGVSDRLLLSEESEDESVPELDDELDDELLFSVVFMASRRRNSAFFGARAPSSVSPRGTEDGRDGIL